jgi:hypothetical protein
MAHVDRRKVRLYRSHTAADDRGYMPGTAEERVSLQCLSDEDVKFLLVGAYALAVHGFPRATKDIDFFVWATPENAGKLIRALAKFGAPWNRSRNPTSPRRA